MKNIQTVLVIVSVLMISATVSGLEIGETDIDTESTETENGVMIESEASYVAPTGGYTMDGTVERISEDEIEISFEIVEPAEDELVTQAITEIDATVEQEIEDLNGSFTVNENITLENETLMEDQYETTADESETQSTGGVWNRFTTFFRDLF